MPVPKRIRDRLVKHIGRFRKVLKDAKARDVSEADTVTIVADLVAAAFGFDKYSEITGEFEIRGTYCDLAIRVDGAVRRLIEVKAIGITLNSRHLRQALGYASNQGIEWIILTNGIAWEVHHVKFDKPITSELIIEIDMLETDLRRDDDIEHLYLLTRESLVKNMLREFKQRREAVNRHVLAALLLFNDGVVRCLRREMHRTCGVRPSVEELQHLLREELIKRDALEGDKAETAQRTVNRSESKALRKKEARSSKKKAASEKKE